jgi:hypothetical protein
MYRKTRPSFVLLGAILLGCAASFLNGMLASFNLGMA